MWYPDLSACDYFGATASRWLRAVGWLEAGQPFAAGSATEELIAKLRVLIVKPYMPLVFMGVHRCDLCVAEHVYGAQNLWIPGQGFLYVCPELILHYVEAHRYRPPEEFIDAVLRCPSMNTPEYERAFIENGGRQVVEALQAPDG